MLNWQRFRVYDFWFAGLAFLLGAGSASVAGAALPRLQTRYQNASARTAGSRLVLSTGRAQRTYQWTGHGFVTIGLKRLASGWHWVNTAPAHGMDWSCPGLLPTDAKAELRGLSARVNDDQGFTTPHLEVVAKVNYPAQDLTVKMVVWIYPDAPGFREQLWVGGRPPLTTPGPRQAPSLAKRKGQSAVHVERRVDYIPVNTSGMRLSAAGYYSDTQHRNTPRTPVLKEQDLPDKGVCTWANLLFVKDGGEGLTLVKESQKTVQTPGVDTGLFRFGPDGIENTGWGLRPEEISPTTYKWLWGSWVLLHAAGRDAREQAVKAFDRLRFPTNKARDMWMVMCTWGHSLSPADGRRYARQDQVLRSLKNCADLGIDMVLIDDGWQSPEGGFLDKENGWRPLPRWYPDGWKPVRRRAHQLGMRLGLWAASSIPLKDMVWNWKHLDQNEFKIDFANLNSYRALNAMRRKARRFMEETGRQCIISWDTTETTPRVGYYSFREYGNVHFMNRKPRTPANVIYVPWLALRDFWLLSRYENLNKWQLVIQNPQTVDRMHSDAYRYGPCYCIATALMGTPEFMALPRFYSRQARSRIRPFLARYRSVRGEIWDSFVYPIGQEPSDGSWTGFQAVHPGTATGYLIIFRELHNPDPDARLSLRFLKAGTPLEFTNLRTDEKWTATLDGQQRVAFSIGQAPGFLFLKYRVLVNGLYKN